MGNHDLQGSPRGVARSASGHLGCLASVDSPLLPLNRLSLEEMLERADETASSAVDDHGDHSNGDHAHDPLDFAISAEDIDFFRSNKHRLQQQRQELRTKLKSQFLDMQRRLGCASPSCWPCANGIVVNCQSKDGSEECNVGVGSAKELGHVSANQSGAEKEKATLCGH